MFEKINFLQNAVLVMNLILDVISRDEQNIANKT